MNAAAEIEIRYSTLRDIPELTRLIALCWRVHNFPYLNERFIASRRGRYGKAEVFVKHLMRQFIVARIDGRIVAYSEMQRRFRLFGLETGFVGQLYVHPDLCRRGIGTRLFSMVRALFYSEGQPDIFLSCLAMNLRSRSFYERQGGIEFLGGLSGPDFIAVPIVYYGFGPACEAKWLEIAGSADTPASRHLL